MNRFIPFAVVLASAAGGACIGHIGGGEGEPGVDGQSLDCSSTVVPLRRLSRARYERTIVDLFGGLVTPSASFPTSSPGYAFDSYAEANGISLPGVESIMQAAEEVAVQAVDHLDVLLPCDPAVIDGACVEAFVRDFGRRAFRRPLTDDEATRLVGVYDGAEGEPKDKVALVVDTVLQMPELLYLLEEGRPGGDGRTVLLTDHEVASRLSYMLWGTMPDEELLAAADAGEVHTAAQIEAQARRLLADRERSAPALVAFVRQWMRLDQFAAATKSTELFPDWAELAPSVEEETNRFIEHVLFEGNATLEELYTSPDAWVNAPLEAYYGLPPQSSGADDWIEVALDPSQRPGLLLRGAMLATLAHSEEPSPTLRGKLVRMQLLCEEIPPPPPQAATVSPGGDTTIERSEWLMGQEFCGKCHALLDGIGIGLMSYDAIGRFTTEPSPAGEIRGWEDGAFQSGAELAAMLAASDEAATCAVRQTLRYAVSRDDAAADACRVDDLAERFRASGGSFVELYADLVTSDAFLTRNLEEDVP
jgi:uncharacterized protein DUF1592/uncharacterized protein DUF1588/uncharacterized protein DUF1595/uncharacterized protein DUF1585/uncharacterized protein DUF1587